MAASTTARVPGHTLRYEGATLGDYGTTLYTGHGSGRCSCGELSPDLPSNNARKRWHREHKAAVIEQSWSSSTEAS